MANNDELSQGCAKGFATIVTALLFIGSCCNETFESCSSSKNEEPKEAVVENTTSNISQSYEAPKEQTTTQVTETPKQKSSVNVLDMIKTIPDNVRIVGVFEAFTDCYQMIYCKKGVYYMRAIYTSDNGKWGDPERLVKTSSKSYRFYEDTGEEFVLTGYSLIGYFEGAEACEWQQLM